MTKVEFFEIITGIAIVAGFGVWCGNLQTNLTNLEKQVNELRGDPSLKNILATIKNDIAKESNAQIERIKNSIKPPSYEDLVVVKPTWLREKNRLRLFSDQVVIFAKRVSSGLTEVDFEVDVSAENSITFKDFKKNERKIFSFKGHNYIVECLDFKEVRDEDRPYQEVNIQIIRQL